jgi:type IV pilus assembly protein PilC
MFKLTPTIPLKLKMHCFKQLAALVKAALPLTQAITLLEATSPHPALTRIFTALQTELAHGSRFSECARQHPLLFNALSCQLIALGEASGELDHALTSLSLATETLYQQRLKRINALAYPCFIFITSHALLFGLLFFVIPQFQTLFADHQNNLPLITQGLFLCANHAGLLLSSELLGFSLLVFAYHRRGLTIFMKLPYLGNLLQDLECHRCLQALSHCLQAGLPLTQGLTLASGFTDVPTLQAAIHDLRQQLYAGTPLGLAMQGHACFPPWITALVKTGEASGTLDHLLHQACQHYDSLITQRVQACLHSLQPLILLIQGALIGGTVIGLYLPIFNLGTLI